MQMQGFSTIMVGIHPLVKKLKENKAKHVEAHNKACDGFRETACNKLLKRAEQVKNGDTVNLIFNISAPVSHEKDYSEIIGMLEFSLATAGEVHGPNPTVELDKEQYRNYIQDQWNWTHQWGTAVSGYCGL